MNILFYLISSSEKLWGGGIQDIMKNEVISLLSGFSVDKSKGVLEPTRVYSAGRKLKLSTKSTFYFIKNIPDLIENDNFIKAIVNYFITHNKPLYFIEHKVISFEDGAQVSIELTEDKITKLKDKIDQTLNCITFKN
ncbi:hypothetical protein JF50_10520 [Pseudoalteromonas luteoviolacea]|uniref:Uncharacterized protein n=1 Tax=Pseudoalteromonas luteoviolacea TaxID=43657 RepID=A0A0C1QRH8_9GAMM|nr:hypothetical protein [Pseudoalteromonas luteoviolacea]KID57602.1 hypothetical protein JF50_10520 [Pseudoalteromonas luteoviolacea]